MKSRLPVVVPLLPLVVLPLLGQSSLLSDPAGNLRQVTPAAAATSVTVSPGWLVRRPGEAALLTAVWVRQSGDTIVWRKAGVTIPGQTTEVLALGAVGAGAEGDYTATVTTTGGARTSNVARLYVDSDGDGLGDSWEVARLGGLTKTGNEDTDGDGVTNLEEFEDGTDPSSNASLHYRLNLAAINGRVSATPLSGTGRYAAGTRVALRAEPLPGWSFQEWTGDFTSLLPEMSLVMNAHRSMEAHFRQPYSVPSAVGPSLAWSTGGDVPWRGVGAQGVPDGMNLAWSGDIGSDQQSWVETVVSGPGTLTWWWRVSSEKKSSSGGGDWLRCELDGEPIHALSGEVPWQPVARTLTPGGHTVRWIYQKDSTNDAGEDSAWIDRVVVTPASAPAISDAIELPANLSITGSGADLWTRQTAVSHDGRDALQSPAIPDHEEAWIETTVAGPGVLRFWWKVSSETVGNDSADRMEFHLDGTKTDFIFGETAWARVEKQLDGTEHRLRWKYIKNNTGSGGADAGWLDEVSFTPPPSLAASVDTTTLAFTTSLQFPWRPDGSAGGSHDGSDFAKSTPPGNDEQSWMETTVTGPGTVSFWWRTSSSPNDHLRLRLDGKEYSAISGNTEWARVLQTVPAGVHQLRWSYEKNASSSGYQDMAYVDEIVWTASIPPPLANAVDSLGMLWTGSGDAFWERDTSTVRDGSDSARAGPFTTSRQTARMETTVTGPGQLTFWWKCAAPNTSSTDYGARLLIDGILVERITGNQDWVQVRRTIPLGSFLVTWEFVRTTASSGNETAWLDAVNFTPEAAIPPAAATESGAALTWTSGGHGQWGGLSSSGAHDGTDMLVSPNLADGESSWVEATVTGPGTLSFWWRVSSQNDDEARYFVDGEELSTRSGEIAWQPYVSALSPGPHILRWAYEKGSSGSAGEDSAFLDEVTFTPSNPPPLADGLDAPQLSWHTSLDNTWFRQTAETHDQSDAVQAGPVPRNGSTYIGTYVTGPGTLTWWWKIAAAAGDDLVFYEDGNQRASITGAVNWAPQSRNVPAGSYFYWWRFDHDSNTPPDSVKAWLDEVVFTPANNPALAAAVEIPAATPFATTGTAGVAAWSSQSSETHDGVDALRSPALGHNQYATFETWVHGPGVLSFWYKVSSQGNRDVLQFSLDGAAPMQWSGEIPWAIHETVLTPGAHRVSWTYRKDGSAVAGQDAAWVDQIAVTRPTVTLAAAADTNLPLATGGAPWEGQAATLLSTDGVDYAVSGRIDPGQQSWMETTVNGPGTLTFLWKNSSTRDDDRLRLLVGGTEVAAIDGETGWLAVTRTVGGGSHSVRWVFDKGSSSTAGVNHGYVDQIAFAPAALPPLADAVDVAASQWFTSSGPAAWSRTTTTTHDRIDAAVSGNPGDNGESWLETDINGPGILSYWWSVSAESSDRLEILIDGIDQNNDISGETDWQLQTHVLGAGAHRLRWRYLTDAGGTAGRNAAWVDEITFLPSTTFSEAVDSATAWRQGGAQPWLGVLVPGAATDYAVTGMDDARGESWTETELKGPGTLGFSWRAPSISSDYLRLFADGLERGWLQGSSDAAWQTGYLTLPAGTHAVRWTHEKNTTGTTNRELAALDQVNFTAASIAPLNDALDEPELLLHTGGVNPWRWQSATKHDGSDAAESGVVANDQQSWMLTQLQGPGMLTFWAKVQSQQGGDVFSLSADLVQLLTASGNVDWFPVAIPIPSGIHSLQWRYRTNSNILTDPNRAWVDELSFQKPGNYPLALAMDALQLQWTAGPASATASGFQTPAAHDGMDAVHFPAAPAESPPPPVWLETTVQGTSQAKFWWRADAGCQMRFLVDGVLSSSLQGRDSGAWQQVTANLDPAQHTLRWEVNRQGGYPFSGAWLDELTGVPAPASTPFQQWLTRYNLTGANAAPAADPDRDRISNLVEFAFELDPRLPFPAQTEGRLPEVSIEGPPDDRRLVIEFIRLAQSGVVYSPQFSDDGIRWSNSSGPVVVLSGDGTREQVRVADSVPANGRPRRFGRVKVSMP